MNDICRQLQVTQGLVQRLPEKAEPLDRCRLCVFARQFKSEGVYTDSPSLAFCPMKRTTTKVDLKKVEAVVCADIKGEGFRSILNVIS